MVPKMSLFVSFVKKTNHSIFFSGKQFWRVAFPSALESGKTITVVVETVFSHALSPFPRQITQSEKQFVVFNGNLYVYSPYKVKTQTTVVNTPTSSIESYTKTKPVAQSENTVTYGPYENQDAFSQVCNTFHLLMLNKYFARHV